MSTPICATCLGAEEVPCYCVTHTLSIRDDLDSGARCKRCRDSGYMDCPSCRPAVPAVPRGLP